MRLTNEILSMIRKYAIKNAIDYGKADQRSVLNKLISLDPDLKSDIKSISTEVQKQVEDVNSMPKQKLQDAYSEYAQEFKLADRERALNTAKPKFILEGAVTGNFVVRASPEPSGYAHIGHAKQAFLNYEFARIYKGKMYLYFDDTNPEKSKQEYVDSMKKDFAWLGIKFDKEYYASDNILKMYDYAKKILKDGSAYVCMCDQQLMKKNRFDGEKCQHRDQAPEQNLRLFEDMLACKFNEGDAVVRFMGNMKSQNTALRDPSLLRIVKAPHYKAGTKYCVWPLYDFNTPIMDSTNGITDIIRSKEYELRDEVLKDILAALALRIPRMHLEARLNIKGNVTHKRVLRELIEKGLVKSWDDPRLMTLMALRRRGIQPEAIKEFVLRFGMSKTDSTVSIDILLAENKKIIEPIAKHLFFVRDPVQVKLKGAEQMKAKLKLHPSNDMGFREYTVNDTFYISKADADKLREGEVIRLKDLMDAKIISIQDGSISAEKGTGTPKSKIIQWVSEGNYEKCDVMVPGQIVDDNNKFNPNSLEVASGYVESYAKQLKERDIVQFERFGLSTLDNAASLQFIFISK